MLSSFCHTKFLTNCTISKQFHSASHCLLVYMVSLVVIMGHKKRRKENKLEQYNDYYCYWDVTFISYSTLEQTFHPSIHGRVTTVTKILDTVYHLWLKNPLSSTGLIPGSGSSCFWRTYHRRLACFHVPENRGRASLQNRVEVLGSDKGQCAKFQLQLWSYTTDAQILSTRLPRWLNRLVVPIICKCSVWNLLHITLLVP